MVYFTIGQGRISITHPYQALPSSPACRHPATAIRGVGPGGFDRGRELWRCRDTPRTGGPAVARAWLGRAVVRRLLSRVPTMRILSVLVCGALLAAATAAVVYGRVNRVEAEAQHGAAPVQPPADPHTVASVRIDGAGLPLATLERVLTTRVGAALRADDLAHDREALVAALVARGHLAAQVTGVRTQWRADGGHVVFDVVAGGAYHVGTVTVDGPLARRYAALAEVPTLLGGQRWDAARAASNAALLREWLARRGARADVALTTRVDHARLSVDVTFTATTSR